MCQYQTNLVRKSPSARRLLRFTFMSYALSRWVHVGCTLGARCLCLRNLKVFLRFPPKKRHSSPFQWAHWLICDCFSMRMRFFHPQRTFSKLALAWPVLQSCAMWNRNESGSMWISSANKIRICCFVQFETNFRTNFYKPGSVPVEKTLWGFQTFLMRNFCLR